MSAGAAASPQPVSSAAHAGAHTRALARVHVVTSTLSRVIASHFDSDAGVDERHIPLAQLPECLRSCAGMFLPADARRFGVQSVHEACLTARQRVEKVARHVSACANHEDGGICVVAGAEVIRIGDQPMLHVHGVSHETCKELLRDVVEDKSRGLQSYHPCLLLVDVAALGDERVASFALHIVQLDGRPDAFALLAIVPPASSVVLNQGKADGIKHPKFRGGSSTTTMDVRHVLSGMPEDIKSVWHAFTDAVAPVHAWQVATLPGVTEDSTVENKSIPWWLEDNWEKPTDPIVKYIREYAAAMLHHGRGATLRFGFHDASLEPTGVYFPGRTLDEAIGEIREAVQKAVFGDECAFPRLSGKVSVRVSPCTSVSPADCLGHDGHVSVLAFHQVKGCLPDATSSRDIDNDSDGRNDAMALVPLLPDGASGTYLPLKDLEFACRSAAALPAAVSAPSIKLANRYETKGTMRVMTEADQILRVVISVEIPAQPVPCVHPLAFRAHQVTKDLAVSKMGSIAEVWLRWRSRSRRECFWQECSRRQHVRVLLQANPTLDPRWRTVLPEAQMYNLAVRTISDDDLNRICRARHLQLALFIVADGERLRSVLRDIVARIVKAHRSVRIHIISDDVAGAWQELLDAGISQDNVSEVGVWLPSSLGDPASSIPAARSTDEVDGDIVSFLQGASPPSLAFLVEHPRAIVQRVCTEALVKVLRRAAAHAIGTSPRVAQVAVRTFGRACGTRTALRSAALTAYGREYFQHVVVVDRAGHVSRWPEAEPVPGLPHKAGVPACTLVLQESSSADGEAALAKLIDGKQCTVLARIVDHGNPRPASAFSVDVEYVLSHEELEDAVSMYSRAFPDAKSELDKLLLSKDEFVHMFFSVALTALRGHFVPARQLLSELFPRSSPAALKQSGLAVWCASLLTVFGPRGSGEGTLVPLPAMLEWPAAERHHSFLLTHLGGRIHPVTFHPAFADLVLEEAAKVLYAGGDVTSAGQYWAKCCLQLSRYPGGIDYIRYVVLESPSRAFTPFVQAMLTFDERSGGETRLALTFAAEFAKQLEQRHAVLLEAGTAQMLPYVHLLRARIIYATAIGRPIDEQQRPLSEAVDAVVAACSKLVGEKLGSHVVATSDALVVMLRRNPGAPVFASVAAKVVGRLAVVQLRTGDASGALRLANALDLLLYMYQHAQREASSESAAAHSTTAERLCLGLERVSPRSAIAISLDGQLAAAYSKWRDELRGSLPVWPPWAARARPDDAMPTSARADRSDYDAQDELEVESDDVVTIDRVAQVFSAAAQRHELAAPAHSASMPTPPTPLTFTGGSFGALACDSSEDSDSHETREGIAPLGPLPA